MADSLDASSRPLTTSSNHPTNDNYSNGNRKRNTSEELVENSNVKIRKTSVEQQHQPSDLTSVTIKKESTDSTTPLIETNNNDTDTTASNNHSTEDNTPITKTVLDDTQLRDQSNTSASTVAAFASLLTSQQQQQFLQTYAQVSGQDLSQLTASSLAQAMVSPISLPGFNLLQQLQAGSVITALPGPPGDIGLDGDSRWTLQHPPYDDSNHDIKNESRIPTTADVNPSSDNNNDNNVINDTTAIAPKGISGPPNATTTTTTTAAAAAAAVVARTVSNDERRQRRLLRNRVAAKECRKKKKQYIQDMEIKIIRLGDQNAALRKEIDDVHNKLAISTIQEPENYRLMKEVEELNAKLGMGHLSSLSTKDDMETTTTTTTTTSSLEAKDTSPTNELSNIVVSTMDSGHQQHMEMPSSLPPTSTSSLSLSLPIVTSTTGSTTNQLTKSLPVSSSPSPSSLASTTTSSSSSSSSSLSPTNSNPSTLILEPLEHPKASTSPPTNILRVTESVIKIEDMDQQRKEINAE